MDQRYAHFQGSHLKSGTVRGSWSGPMSGKDRIIAGLPQYREYGTEVSRGGTVG